MTLTEEEPLRPLTSRQKQVLAVIQQSITHQGYPPTVRELGDRLGIRSTNGVNDHLVALAKKGYLKKDSLKSRALALVTAKDRADKEPWSDGMVEVPILGRVAAGQPILAQEHQEGRLKMDPQLVGKHQQVFALRVRGDSMIDAGILDGDFVFVRSQPVAKAGDIVVALIDDEATVKYYQPDKDHVVLAPANKHMQPILVHMDDSRSVRLLGIVQGIYRNL